MDVQELYDLIESHLGNSICSPQSKMGKRKRMRMPIPEEFGGGIVTGYGYEETIRNLIHRVQDKIKMEPNSPLFEECYEKWMNLKEGQEKAASTIAAYKWIARTYLLPFFKSIPINQITSDDIQRYFNSIMTKSESISTQSKAVLSGIFDRAIRNGEIEQNPMLFKYERSRKRGEKVVLQDSDLISTIQQLDKLKKEDRRDYLYFCFLCFTSMRRGEILGLRWKDIDFESNTIYVRNNVTFPNGQNEPVLHHPKDGSFGSIHLQSELKSRIRSYAKAGNYYILPYALDKPCSPMTKSMFVKMWNRIKKTIDLKGATSHSFRASYATMMNAHCSHIDPKVLQGILRHKTPNLAIKIYTKENKSKSIIAEEEYDQWLTRKIHSI